MECLSPPGDVDMSGTNTARHLTVRGALAALTALEQPGFYKRLAELNDYLVTGLRQLCADHDIPAYVEGYGGRVGLHIGSYERPQNMAQVAQRWNREFHLACYRHIAESGKSYGLILPLRLCPEPITISSAHTHADIDVALSLLHDAFTSVRYKAA